MTARPGGGARWYHGLGPGIAVAATGVGAGDLVAAAVSGSRYGYALVWTAVIGALLKFTLNEGLARWQLATGTTLLEGWATQFGRWLHALFLVYLALWSLVVAGALISACGLAAHAIAPILSVEAWGVVHSLVAAVLVLRGRYDSFERLMKLFIGVMFVALIGSAVLAGSPLESLSLSLRHASIPSGGVAHLLGVIGGVGGSVTLLSYGYWMRERGWNAKRDLRQVRIDLSVAYLLTGLFGVAVIVLAARVLHADGIEIQGASGALQMSEMVGRVVGSLGRWLFLIGFWGAVATSLLGVWHGVPYLFGDFVRAIRPDGKRAGAVDSRSVEYRGFLLYLTLPPLALLLFGRPVALVVVYAVLGSLFIPFLAGTLLVMNRRHAAESGMRTGALGTTLLLACLGLFGYLSYLELARRLWAD